MQTLKYKINARETYIAMLLIFKNVLPRDMINHIYSYVHTKDTNKIIYKKFDIYIKEITQNMNHKFTKGGYYMINCMISVFIEKMVYMGIYLTKWNASTCINWDASACDDKKKIRNTKIDSGSKLHPKRVESIMREYLIKYNNNERTNIRMGIGAPLYLTGVLDTIVKELIISSSTYKISRSLISMDSIINGCKNNPTLKLLFCELFV